MHCSRNQGCISESVLLHHSTFFRREYSLVGNLVYTLDSNTGIHRLHNHRSICLRFFDKFVIISKFPSGLTVINLVGFTVWF